MATQSQLEQPTSVDTTADAQQKPEGGSTVKEARENDLAWEIVKEECHDGQ